MSQTPPPLPKVYRERTDHRVLQSLKEAVSASLNYRARSVLRQRDLGICFLSLGRHREALEILDYAQGVTFRGKYDVWYAAASACSISTYTRRELLREHAGVAGLERFLSPPAHALVSQPGLWTPSFIAKHLTGEEARLLPSFSHTNLAVAAEALAWWTATLVFFHEMAHLGYPSETSAESARLRASIEDALEQTRALLAGPSVASRSPTGGS